MHTLRGIAQRLQEAALGGLTPAILWRLQRLAPDGNRPQPRRGLTQDRLKPGTTLVRGWRGRTHTVAIREDGFGYQGRLYRSLSLIARQITGAHWSGPRFFGLTDGQRSARTAQIASARE